MDSDRLIEEIKVRYEALSTGKQQKFIRFLDKMPSAAYPIHTGGK